MGFRDRCLASEINFGLSKIRTARKFGLSLWAFAMTTTLVLVCVMDTLFLCSVRTSKQGPTDNALW